MTLERTEAMDAGAVERIANLIGRILASQVTRNNMPDMSGDNRNRMSPTMRRQWDDACLSAAEEVLTTLAPAAESKAYDPTTQPYDEPFRHVEAALTPSPSVHAEAMDAGAVEKLAEIIRKELLGVAPDEQSVVLEDDDWRLILAALTPSPSVPAEIAAEHYIQEAIDRAPEPLRRLGEWLATVLDENDWKTAESMLLGAALTPSPSVPAPDDYVLRLEQRLVHANDRATAAEADRDRLTAERDAIAQDLRSALHREIEGRKDRDRLTADLGEAVKALEELLTEAEDVFVCMADATGINRHNLPAPFLRARDVHASLRARSEASHGG